MSVDLAAKSVRRGKLTISEHGVTALVQGKLVADRIEDAGLVAQAKPSGEAA